MQVTHTLMQRDTSRQQDRNPNNERAANRSNSTTHATNAGHIYKAHSNRQCWFMDPSTAWPVYGASHSMRGLSMGADVAYKEL